MAAIQQGPEVLEDLTPYAGSWVAIRNGKVIASALDAVALLLLQDHTEHCVVEAIQAGDGSKKVRELNEAVERLVKGR